MRKIIPILLAIFILLFIYTSISCGFGGVKALGMGNAFVALADDGTAPYWNPAGITQINFSVMGGLGGLSNLGQPSDYANVGLNGGITTKYIALSLFGYSISYDPYFVSEIDFVGTIGIPIGRHLAIGGNYKLLNPEKRLPETNGLRYSGTGQSIDIGILYKPLNDDTLRLGLVGYDINNPHIILKTIENFDINNGDLNIYFKPTFKAGIAWKPIKSITLASDLTLLSGGFRVSGGAEFVIEKIIALRIGFYKYSDIQDIAKTFGAGLKFGPLFADIAFLYSNTYISAGLKF